MPFFDGTGPMGQGPGTGRCMGLCMGGGFRFGRGRGFGRGPGRRFGPGPGRDFGGRFFWQKPPSKDDQKNFVQDYKKALEEELEAVNQELAELEK